MHTAGTPGSRAESLLLLSSLLLICTGTASFTSFFFICSAGR